MKHIHSLSLVALFIIAITSSSCKDGDIGLGTFNATINGESWSALAPTGIKTGNRLTITGLSVDKQIVINVANAAPGTYDMSLIEGSINPLVYTPNVSTQQGAQQTYAATGGNIIVTKVEDKRVSGTFNVSATNTSMGVININGDFANVKFF
jgi:hypothetical protein